MSEYVSPVYNVKAIPVEKIRANNYNPNKVAPPEMKLLEISIWEDGFTQPIVCYHDKANDEYIVVDGFHRFTTMLTSERIRHREKGMMPVVVIDKELGERMASTIRHNRAELLEMGKSDSWICRNIGMSADELLRLKQITGLANLFKDEDFSKSWEVTK